MNLKGSIDTFNVIFVFHGNYQVLNATILKQSDLS